MHSANIFWLLTCSIHFAKCWGKQWWIKRGSRPWEIQVWWSVGSSEYRSITMWYGKYYFSDVEGQNNLPGNVRRPHLKDKNFPGR